MSGDRRPTREEAIKAIGLRERSVFASAMDEAQVRAMDRTADLFGGFAPSAVEVPRVTWVRAEKLGIDAVVDRDGRLLSLPIIEAVAARSNAWEEVKDTIAQTLMMVGSSREEWREAPTETLDRLLAKMSEPRFGLGPGGKP